MSTPGDRGRRFPALPPWAAPAAIAVIALGAVFWRLSAGQVVYHRDVARLWVPAAAFIRNTVLGGEAPWWNPDVGIGFNALSDPLFGIFYPPNLADLFASAPHVLAWWLFFHALLGGAGAAVLVRAAGGRGKASVVAALAWTLSSFVAAQWTIGRQLAASAWMPWLGAGFMVLARAVTEARPLRRAVGLAALPAALVYLLGDVFFATMAVGFGLAVGAIFVVAGSAPGTRRRVLLRYAAACAAALAIAAALSAPAVLTAAVAAGATERAAPLSRSVAEMWSVHPQRLLDLVVAGGHGLAWETHATEDWVERIMDGAHPMSMRYYVGGSVFALALLALGRRRDDGEQRRRRVVALGCAMVAGAAILLALGRYLPVHAAVRALVRPLAYMRFPEKYLLVLQAAIAVLAGLGLQRLDSETAPPWKRLAGLAAALLGLAAAAPLLFPGGLAPTMSAGAVHGALGALGVTAAVLLARRAPRAAPLLALAVVAADLAAASCSTLRFGPAALIDARPPLADEILRRYRPPVPGLRPRLYRSPTVQSLIPLPAGDAPDLRSRDTLRDNLSLLHGIAILPGYDPATPLALTRVLDLQRRDVLRLLGADFALLRDRGAPTPGLTPILAPQPGLVLSRVDHPLPRVYRAGRAEILPDDLAVPRLLDEDVLSGRTVLLDTAPPTALEDDAAAPADGCRLLTFAANRIEAACTGTRPALAVFVEQYAPGWRATVNGAPAPVLRANTVGRAVPVPPGAARIVLTFTPPALRPALAAAGAGLLALLACFVRRRRLHRQ